ncbi:MAG: hypothetical protein KatS3mg082_2476 [Nitrospiraceae bacterium]|nr:MAG: hypothetical protein KatS3mg082_2476 [Nitrospiraceae bacterium]
MRSAGWLAALLLAAWPAAAAMAQPSGCGDAVVQIERLLEDAIRIEVIDPCQAGRFVTFRHNGEEVARLADADGRVRLLRFLGPGPHRIELLRTDGSWQLLFEETAAAASTAGERQAAPRPQTGGGQSEGGTEAGGSEAGGKTTAERRWQPEATPTAPAAEPAQTPLMRPRGPLPWAMRVDEACRVRVEAEQQAPGLVRFRLFDGCAAGRMVRVDQRERGWRFYVELVGEASELLVPLIDPVSTFDFVVENGGVTTVRVESPDLDSLVRVVLLWEAAVDLDLVVVEPSGRVGGEPGAEGGARGVIERRDAGKGGGYALESYRLPLAAFAETGAALGVSVRQRRGDARLEAAECDPGARIDYRILVRLRGKVQERRFRVPEAACDTLRGESERRALTVTVPRVVTLFPQ